ncbi:MAG: hypothetical protein ACRD3B_08340, partial [Candidatus Sulfotelmatobacter sp.]
MGTSPPDLLAKRISFFAVFLMATAFLCASAQVSDPHASRDSKQGMQPMQMNVAEHDSSLPSPHEGSGTSWQPASVSGHEWMWMRS